MCCFQCFCLIAVAKHCCSCFAAERSSNKWFYQGGVKNNVAECNLAAEFSTWLLRSFIKLFMLAVRKLLVG